MRYAAYDKLHEQRQSILEKLYTIRKKGVLLFPDVKLHITRVKHNVERPTNDIRQLGHLRDCINEADDFINQF